MAVKETPAVLPPDPELDAEVLRILDGAPYTGYQARPIEPRPAGPKLVPVHCAVALCLGLLIGFAASAILL